MSGTIVSQNIKIGNLQVGDNWNLTENSEGKLSFEHNEIAQMTLASTSSNNGKTKE